MINKSKLWFLTLSSIILVLAVYYIAIPSPATSLVFSSNNKENTSEIEITESEALTAMRITKDEEDLATMQTLQEVLLDSTKSVEEKNDAYEKIKYLNANKSLEEKLEKDIYNSFKLNSFVSINENNLKVVVANKEKSVGTANDIIKYINNSTDQNYYVSVKFE
ncbi:MAG: SpoIIIAH-like family protein [Erysipelotrichales bacterium]|nr:SpoIIIAH-like family protein [Erysipelotrichales bacterium]